MIKIPVRQRAMMVQSMLLMPILLLAQKDRWNYLLVFNWDLNKNWCVMAEAGFGGSRENFIGGVTYPF